MSVRKIVSAAAGLVAFAATGFGYGPTGHEIVGGIADKLVANTTAGTRINSLLDGISLEKAAVIADEIKAWDKDGVDDPEAFPHYRDHEKIDQQLREFWRANPPTHDRKSETPSHHWFHYTDVPVLDLHRYSDGRTGRDQWDIVHMISYCIGVLRGEIPENNPRKITKPLAVILLAHYVGDIHQPLHVGAMYFDQASGRAVDPDKGQAGIEDEGGNTIVLRLYHGTAEEMAKRGLKLHGLWDNEAVMANLSLASAIPKEQRYQAIEKAKRQLIDELAHEQPANWRLAATVPLKNYAEAWVDEILPVAREAHERLQFIKVHAQMEEDRTVAAGTAQERDAPDHVTYADWTAKIVREELHKAGWRLADLLNQALTGTRTAAAGSASVPTPVSTPLLQTRSAGATPPSATPSPVEASPYGEYPANYKEIVTTWMKANQLDGSTIDWQGDPKPIDMPTAPGTHRYGYLVIFNTFERSSPKTRSVLIRDGAVISSAGF
jgi:hypothetical protein